jgi:ketosteroid isomerase-like protein
MSQAKVELVRRAFEAYADGGLEAVVPFYTPDVVWLAASQWPEDSAYEGIDANRRQDEVWHASFDDYGWEVHDIRDAQDRVLVLAEMVGRTKTDSVELRQRVGLLARFRGEQISEVKAYGTWQEGLEAVGLSE